MSSVRVTSGSLEVIVEDDRARASTLLREAVKAIRDLPEPIVAPVVANLAAGFETEIAADEHQCDPSDQHKRPVRAVAGAIGFRLKNTPPPRR